MWPREGEGVAEYRHRGCQRRSWVGTHVDLALGPCDRLPDVHHAFGEVEVAATEPANLRGPQARLLSR
jgi:hypothetical protein